MKKLLVASSNLAGNVPVAVRRPRERPGMSEGKKEGSYRGGGRERGRKRRS